MPEPFEGALRPLNRHIYREEVAIFTGEKPIVHNTFQRDAEVRLLKYKILGAEEKAVRVIHAIAAIDTQDGYVPGGSSDD